MASRRSPVRVGSGPLDFFGIFGSVILTISLHIKKSIINKLNYRIGKEAITRRETESADRFAVRRDYAEIVAGKNVLMVDDILTTGGSAKKVIEATRACGGNVVGLGALWNSGGISAREMGTPKLVALVNERLETWDENSCLLCWRNIPINWTAEPLLFSDVFVCFIFKNLYNLSRDKFAESYRDYSRRQPALGEKQGTAFVFRT